MPGIPILKELNPLGPGTKKHMQLFKSDDGWCYVTLRGLWVERMHLKLDLQNKPHMVQNKKGNLDD